MDASNRSVAVVVGGASGLGAATAAQLTAQGLRVVVVDLPRARERFWSESTTDAHFIAGDVTDSDQIRTAMDEATTFGPVRVVVSCAGIATPGRILGRSGVLPLDQFRSVVDINLVGTFNVLSQAARVMAALDPVDGERGVIVCTSSIAAFDGQIGQAAYAASKGGVASLTLTAARDLADKLIRVVTIAPGLFDTPLLQGLPQPARDALGGSVPHPARLGRPSEFASLVAALIANPMVNGEVVRIDGALRMAPR